jgi:NAD(P)-dependent dehydrogenase (short-subunit alcohol dehydrogenase family)
VDIMLELRQKRFADETRVCFSEKDTRSAERVQCHARKAARHASSITNCIMAETMTGRVAIVTGASSGIGEAIAIAFGREGARVVLGGRRVEELARVAAVISDGGGSALAVPGDVRREADVLDLFATAKRTYGRVDVLVNNAGVTAHKPIDEMSLEYWNDVVAANLTSAFLASREAIKIMKAQDPQGGRIISTGSVSQKTPRADSLAYTATKHALQGLTHQLTMDGRAYGVVASIIHPGSTLSGFTRRTSGRTAAGAGATPQQYVMAAEDVARVAVLMATLPPEVNLYEATILPNHMRSFIDRG